RWRAAIRRTLPDAGAGYRQIALRSRHASRWTADRIDLVAADMSDRAGGESCGGCSMKRARPWPLDKLLVANRNAGTVYSALRWLAGDARRLSTTRKRIAAICGLYRDKITAAMHALSDAAWLALNYGRNGNRAWYRISFPEAGFFPVSVKTRHSKRSA